MFGITSVSALNPHTGDGGGVFYPQHRFCYSSQICRQDRAEIFGDIVTDIFKFKKPLSSCEYPFPFYQDMTGSKDEKLEKVIISWANRLYDLLKGKPQFLRYMVDGLWEQRFVPLQEVVRRQLTAWIQYGGR